MKVQNQVSFKQLIFEFPLNEISSVYMPDLYFEPSSAISIEEQEETEDVADVTEPGTSRPLSVPGLILLFFLTTDFINAQLNNNLFLN